MESYLLATKLRVPPQTSHVVHRPRLVEALERDMPDYKLVLLAAPAGYGKTTLLAQWAHASRLPVAWLSLGEEENDPERFLRYLLAAWEQIYSDVHESPAGMLLGARAPDRDAALAAIINVANDVPDHTALILDDYHLIDDEAVHQAMTFLLDHLPPTMHVVLAGRGEPPLPLSRYRARDELLELGTDELQFGVDEAAEFLRRQMGRSLTDGEVSSLQAQLEGWIAGLQLASLTLRHRAEPADQLAITGQHRFIADYLSEDVLAHLPDEVQRFLLQTSILERLSGPLCDAVTGRDDGQQMLETLERENLFLMPLDDSRQWYRYHRLFADFLQTELKRRHPGEETALHRRAAGWYLAHDLAEPAFQHALDGDDLELVTRILELYTCMKLNCGELRLMAQWLDAIPASWYSARPAIGLIRAGLMAYTGAFEACIQGVNDVEQRLAQQTGNTRWQMAMVTSIRCFIACIQNDVEQAELYADQSLKDLREEGISFRATIYQALGDTYRGNGRWEEAREHYLQVLNFPDAPGFHVQSAHVYGALADLALRQGRLREASGHWRQALAAIQEPESWGRVELPAIGWVFIRMGELAYERNEIAEAWDHLSRGLERSELGGDVRAMIAGYLIAGRIALTEGDIEAASDYLERARPLVEQAPFPEWVGQFERLQLELWLRQDRLRAAVDWSDAMLRDDDLERRPEHEPARLAIARALIVKGDRPAVEQALTLLEHLSRAAEAGGRVGVVIEALALESLGQWRRGERTEAMTVLERALRLAEPEGYVRLFADLGLPMARLLQEARSREVMPDYVTTLLAACGPDLAQPDVTERPLPEPLTDREQEILELLAAGLTNREIAERLFVSPETVKKHTGNIYGKLGVRGRTEAVARSRELQLLG